MDAVAAWRQRHPGVTASAPTCWWVRAVGVLAPPASRLPAGVWTVAGIGCAAAAVPGPLPGVWLLAGAVCDSLDGAVASERGTASERGRRLDHAADRVADGLLLAALGRRGAPPALCAVAFGCVLVLESGRRGSTRLTPGERPMRLAVAVLGMRRPSVAAAGIGGLALLSARRLARSAPR